MPPRESGGVALGSTSLNRLGALGPRVLSLFLSRWHPISLGPSPSHPRPFASARAGTPYVRQHLQAGGSAEDFVYWWQSQEEAFRLRRAPYLIY